MGNRLRVGIVGCGLVAQVMHLHYLRELSELYEVVALCDVSPDLRAACARDYNVHYTSGDWRDLLSQSLDALFILTSGSHAPIAIAAAQAGLHILVEKPMCFSVQEGQAMMAAAERAQVTLMVAYNKRYDPAYRRFAEEVRQLQDIRLARITTLEAPFVPYVAHYRLHRPGPLPHAVQAAFGADTAARIASAVGEVDPLLARAYHLVLVDSLVHEFNTVRGLLGEPDQLTFADLTEHGVTAVLRFGATQCVLNWVDLPSIARYTMEFAFYAPHSRLTLAFPSPFLRSAPTLLTREGGEPGTPRSWQTEEITAYDESFREELIHFHACVTSSIAPITSGTDALNDIALCQSVIDVHRRRAPRDRPSAWVPHVSQG
jgi:predicted dehydrogenase